LTTSIPGSSTRLTRTTGYTGSIIVGLLLAGRMKACGAASLEYVFADHDLYGKLRDEMARRGMIFSEGQI